MKFNLIFDVNLGKDSFVDNKGSWTKVEISDYLFFSREDINQKIRLGSKVEIGSSSLSFYKDGQILPFNVKWVNSYNNLNPMLFNVNKKEEEYKEHIVYITMDNSLKLLRFKSFFSILQTYHKRDEYQGCAIIIPEKKLDHEKPIFELTVKNLETNRYQYIKIYLTDDSEIKIDQQDVRSRKLVSELRKIDNRKSYVHFKVKVPKKTFLTNTYFCKNQEDSEKIMELTEGIKNKNVIDLSRYHSEDEKTSAINDALLGSHTRAFTIVGDADVPYELWKENKQLYIFKYDIEEEALICLKSN